MPPKKKPVPSSPKGWVISPASKKVIKVGGVAYNALTSAQKASAKKVATPVKKVAKAKVPKKVVKKTPAKKTSPPKTSSKTSPKTSPAAKPTPKITKKKWVVKKTTPPKSSPKYTETSLAKMKAVDLKVMAAAKGSLKGLTKKQQFIDVILGKLAPVAAGVAKAGGRRVNPRKIIKGPKSRAPTFWEEGNCRALVGNQKLMDHQEIVLDHFDKYDGLILFAAPGSGKTLTAASASLCWLLKNPDGMIFFAAPGPLIDNFLEKGLKKFYGLSHNFIAKYFVVDTYRKIVKYVEAKGLTKKPYFLIVDEAHNLKTGMRIVSKGKHKGKEKGASPRGILDLARNKNCKKVLVMTGTVFRNTEKDLENLVAISRKGDYEPIRKTKKYNKNTRKYETNGEKIREYFKCLISYYPGGSDEDYPKVVKHEEPIRMSKTYWKNKSGNGYYDTHLRVKASLKRTKGEKGDKEEKGEMYVIAMRSKANKNYIESEAKLESPKADWIVKKIQENPTQKTIIYSFFIESGIEAVQAKLETAGIKSTFIRQSLSAKEKTRIIDDYNAAPENDISKGNGIILITKATSEGIDFKGTRRIIIMEKDFSSAAINQIVARGARYLSHVHLPPADRRVDVYFLKLLLPEGVSRPEEENGPLLTIDERIDEIIKGKDLEEKKFMDFIVGPGSKVTIEKDPDCKMGKIAKSKTK